MASPHVHVPLVAALSGREWVSVEKLPQQRGHVLPSHPQGRPVRRCTSFHDYCSPHGKCVQVHTSGVWWSQCAPLGLQELTSPPRLHLRGIPAYQQRQECYALHATHFTCPAHSASRLVTTPFHEPAAGPSLDMTPFPRRGSTHCLLDASEGAVGTSWWGERPCLLCTHRVKRILRLKESWGGRARQVMGELISCW